MTPDELGLAVEALLASYVESGMHAIQERAVVRKGEIVVRPMMNLALSYDHRLIDGREAVTFLVKVKEAIEEPTSLLLF